MGNGIPGPPNQYGYGLEFDYSVWVPGTQVDLVNVPFNNDYRDVVKFNNRAELNAYIDSLSGAGLEYTQLSYIKPNQPVYLPITHSRALRYNYIRVSNPLQPVEGGDSLKYYYYFILDAEYVNPNNTRFILQLDVWQTYVYDMTFGNCYVERGHIGIANENSFDNYGRDYLTIPEGHDLGSDYTVVMARKKWVMSPTPWNEGMDSRYPSYDILVVSTVDLLADPGTAAAPVLKAATGSNFQGTTHGAAFYVFDSLSFQTFLQAVSDKPWVSQGIISITMIPKVNRYHPEFGYAPYPSPTPAPQVPPRQIAHHMQTNWREHPDIYNYIPPRYRSLRKFWTFPYMVIEMTTYMGTPIALKPQAWNNPDAIVQERVSLIPPGQRIEFHPVFYNSRFSGYADTEQLWPPPMNPANPLAGVRGDDYGEYLDLVTQIANFPTMAIVNNGAISYLASNQHGIAHQYRSTDWSQQRALGMAQGQYDVATGAMNTAREILGADRTADFGNTGNQNRTQVAQAAVGAAGGLVAGAGGGAVFGPVGAAAGAVGGAVQGGAQLIGSGIQAASNDEGLAIRNRQASDVWQSQNRQAALMRNTNQSLAEFAAKGDYSNARDAINAKVQDAALIQPTTSGQMGGETINMINGGLQVSVRWKMIDQARIRDIGEIWLRYGYAVHASMVPPQSLKVMNKFTYWKMSETYIAAGNVPEGFKQAIRGILEKGVTVWNNPSEIGIIDWAENHILPDINYGAGYTPPPPTPPIEGARPIMRIIRYDDSGVHALVGAGYFIHTTSQVKANAWARVWGDASVVDTDAYDEQEAIAVTVIDADV